MWTPVAFRALHLLAEAPCVRVVVARSSEGTKSPEDLNRLSD